MIPFRQIPDRLRSPFFFTEISGLPPEASAAVDGSDCTPTTTRILDTTIDQSIPIVLTYSLNGEAPITITEIGDGVDDAYTRLLWLFKNSHTGINLLANSGSGGFTSFIHDLVGSSNAISGLAEADFNEQIGSSVISNTYVFIRSALFGYPDGAIDAITFFADFDQDDHPTITMHSCVINHYTGV